MNATLDVGGRAIEKSCIEARKAFWEGRASSRAVGTTVMANRRWTAAQDVMRHRVRARWLSRRSSRNSSLCTLFLSHPFWRLPACDHDDGGIDLHFATAISGGVHEEDISYRICRGVREFFAAGPKLASNV